MMKMKRCLIVTGGTIDIAFAKDFLSQRSYDYVIAADAGLEVLRPLHISPNAVVGDLDTVDKKVLEEYQNQPGIEFEIHKPEKDETDTELALLTARARAVRQLISWGRWAAVWITPSAISS